MRERTKFLVSGGFQGFTGSVRFVLEVPNASETLETPWNTPEARWYNHGTTWNSLKSPRNLLKFTGTPLKLPKTLWKSSWNSLKHPRLPLKLFQPSGTSLESPWKSPKPPRTTLKNPGMDRLWNPLVSLGKPLEHHRNVPEIPRNNTELFWNLCGCWEVGLLPVGTLR